MTDAAAQTAVSRTPDGTATLDLEHVDYSDLTEPITDAQVAKFRSRFPSGSLAAAAPASRAATSVISLVFAVGFIVVFLAGAGVSIGTIVSDTADWNAPFGVGGAVIVVVFVVIAFGIFHRTRPVAADWGTWMRMAHFARANGLRFHSSHTRVDYPGSVFSVGTRRTVFEHFVAASGRYLDFGRYRYSTGTGRDRSIHVWGYLALQLDRKLPNMVLDSTANNGLFGSTDLPQRFTRDQVLPLEGDFDKSFTLYCPKQYEQDALYVFTPDLMALLVDDAAPYDVEIVDDWMFIYSPTPFPQLDPATYARLFRIVAAVGAKAVSQTEHYHDDRVQAQDDDEVAPSGQRLRHGLSIGGLVVFGGAAVFWLANLIIGFLQP